MAGTSQDQYVCTLSPEALEKAKAELNEDPATRHLEVKAFRERVEKYNGLNARTDDAFLLRFLRAKKFDQERAFQILLNFYKIRQENPEIFEGLTPSKVRQVLEDGVTGVLPHRDKEGRRVLVFRPGLWNTEKYSLNQIFQTNYLTMLKLIEEEDTQVHGIVLLYDLKDVGWQQLKQINPIMAKKISTLIQDAFPGRFKAMHYLHEPAIFDKVFSIIKQFLKEKLTKRIQMHGSNIEEMREFIDEQYLPTEYGGQGPKFSNADWMATLLAAEEEFRKEVTYGFIKIGAVGDKKKSQDAVENVTGTFRKLDV